MAVTHARPVESVVTGTRPGRALARRFVAGETLGDAVAVTRRLNAEGFRVSLDLLGEEVHDRASVMEATDGYVDCLDIIAAEGLEANISIKPTQVGLAIDAELALAAVDRLATRAGEVGTTVTLDMEDSRYTEATVSLYEKTQPQHGNLGIALQAYLHRTEQDLARLIPLGGHIRLCKGAYLESEQVALTSKAEVDAAFATYLEALMAAEETEPAVATHDLALVEQSRHLASGREQPFEFQMLYGVRPDLQQRLIHEGYPLRVYLPFGSQWYPYLTRRLAERPANAWLFLRAVFSR